MILRAFSSWLLLSRQALKSSLYLLMLTGMLILFSSALLIWDAWRAVPPPPTWDPIFVERFDDARVLEDTYRSAPDLGQQEVESAWKVEEGRLWGEGGHNSALWFSKLKLPAQARIEFTARAESDTGDLKCELYGDGATHQSGMIVINGGWHNKLRVIARRDEHGEDRKEDRRCAPHCAPKGIEQHWVIERYEGVISWYLDGVLALKWYEGEPLHGHFFAFNHWEAKVSYDNLIVYNLSSPP